MANFHWLNPVSADFGATADWSSGTVPGAPDGAMHAPGAAPATPFTGPTTDHWLTAVSADFNTAADWSTGTVPGAGNAAILDAAGKAAYTVTASTSETVDDIQTGKTATLAITGGTFTIINGTGSGVNAGTIVVDNNRLLDIQGTFKNTGTIAIDSTGSGTGVSIQGATTLTGGGKFILNDNAGDYVRGAAASDTLTNVDNVISGGGQLGSGVMTLVNQSKGVIDATGVNNALVLNTSGQTVANAGLIEATGAAGLVILSTAVNSSTGGVILAASGSNIALLSAHIIGGTLTTAGTGVIHEADNGSLIDGATLAIKNQGVLAVDNSKILFVQGSIVNTGTIALNSTGSGGGIRITAMNATLTGGGRVILTDNGGNYIDGASGAILTNFDNTISGAGQLGRGSLAIVNQASGLIDATGANALVVNAGSGVVTNLGTLEATGVGGLVLSSTVDNGGGVILAANGSNVALVSADIVGGTLTTVGTGLIHAADDFSVLDGTTFAVDNTSVVAVDNNLRLTIQGTINNTGKIETNGTSSTTGVVVSAANATLIGAGQFNLGANGLGYVIGAAATDTLTNFNNTISGAGQLGDGRLTLVNQAAGLIDATSATHALYLTTGTVAVTNTGLIEGTGAAGLVIQSTTVNGSSGGVILAANGSAVLLESADIVGGALKTSGTGVIEEANNGSLIDGATSAITNQGLLAVQNNLILFVQGSIVNTGTIALDSAGSNGGIQITNTNATLTGGGKVILTDFGGNYIEGASGAATLTNVDNTISGAGQLGRGVLTLVNDAAGLIDANGVNALTVNFGSGALTNHGTIEATGAGGLVFTNTINDTGGVILAANGSHASLASAHIVGGTLKTSGSGIIEAVDNGSLIDGSTSAMTNQGLLAVQNNLIMFVQGSIVNTGTIALDSAGSSGGIQITAMNATLTGGGKVVLTDFAGNYIEGASGAILTNFDNTISGAGQLGRGSLAIVNDAAGVFDATGANALVVNVGSGALTNHGTMEATGAGGLTVASNLDNAGGTIFAGAGSSVSLQNSTFEGGALTTAAGGVIINTGVLAIGDGATVSASGAVTNKGAITLNSSKATTDLIISGALTLSGGGTVTLTDNVQNQIVGSSTSAVLTNVDNTISGSGQLGAGQLTLINQAKGVVDANGTKGLIIDTAGVIFVNNGLLEGTGSGGLGIENTTVDNSGGGVIMSTVTGGVGLNGAHIIGGTLTSAGGGFISTYGVASILDGGSGTLTNLATVAIFDKTALTLQGAITNGGKIVLGGTAPNQKAGGVADLIVGAAGATLSGDGSVVLGTHEVNQISGATAGATLTIIDEKILGGGQLGNGQLKLVNGRAGVIDANGETALVINTGANTITNAGMIEATGEGVATIAGAITNTGKILANGANVTVGGNIGGKGGEVISAAATLEIASSYGAGANQAVSFAIGAMGTFKIDQAQNFTGTLTGLATGNTLDLANINVATASLSYTGTTTSGTLTVTDGTTTATIALIGNYTQANFAPLANDGGGHTDVRYNGTGMAFAPSRAAISTIPPHQFISAMAGLGISSAASAPGIAEPHAPAPAMLASARLNLA